ncbi:MAG: hypothetical protein ACRYGF_17570 [Janthinobacterium lividum]
MLLVTGAAAAEPLEVKHHQGEVHAFLAIRSDEGKLLGMADVVNVSTGKTWQSRLTIHFRDGSVDDDTTVYTQTSVFRLLSDHHVQKGPTFPTPSDVTIDVAKGDVTYCECKDGKDELKTEHMDLPADLGNGMMPMLLQNMPKGSEEIKVGYLVTNPKPRLVKLAIHPEGSDTYHVGGVARSAAKYRLHIDIGGIAGVVAPIIGKEPPDLTAWITSGAAPTFLKINSFLYLGGPMLQMELASPSW